MGWAEGEATGGKRARGKFNNYDNYEKRIRHEVIVVQFARRLQEVPNPQPGRVQVSSLDVFVNA